MTGQPEPNQRRVPTSDRPRMPSGYGVPTTEQGMLPWSHARERLERAYVYWIATTRPDGRPHVSPVWGVWVDDTLYFGGDPQTRRVRNLATHPAIAVHLESDDGKDVVIVEGEAHELRAPDHALAVRIAAAYAAKYASDGYEPSPDSWDGGGLSVMHPRVALAWMDLSKDPTRWHFDAQ